MTPTFAGAASRKACAATLAAALAITSATTAPARAEGNGDALAVAAFFGLVAAVIVATARRETAHPGGHPLPPVVSPRRPLPADCRFDIRYGPDRGSWYGRQCLVAQYSDWGALPGACAERVELPRLGYDLVAYEAGCLERHGMVTADRRYIHRDDRP